MPFESVNRLGLVRAPQADFMVSTTTGKQQAFRVPLDLFYCFRATKGLDRALGLLYVPQVNRLAVSCHSEGRATLPVNLSGLKLRINRLVVHFRDVFG